LERQQAADQAHLKFRDDRSDFLSLVALWDFFADALSRKLSHRQLVDACRAQFVSYLRLREWRDVHQQLVSVLEDAGWAWPRELPRTYDAPRYATLHKALLAGFLGNIGGKNDADDGFLGARGIKFYLHPGSGIARKSNKWVLAAELTETTRLFARCAAKIEPEWIEMVAGDLVTREHFDPHWDERRGEVVGSERVSLYGLTLVARRPVSFGAIDPAAARDVFIREALVAGSIKTRGSFLAQNRKLIGEIAELEHKARRSDVLVDDAKIAAFYAERIPADVCSTGSFERWRQGVAERDPATLALTREHLMRHAATQVTVELYPEQLAVSGTTLPLKYRFAPGHPLDGLTATVPLALLNQVDEARLTWLVPGMIREKVTHYLKNLPKGWRNRLIPLPETVTSFLEATPIGKTPLTDALRAWLHERLGDAPDAGVWSGAALPNHLAVNIQVVDAAGRELAAGRDLRALRTQLGEAAQLTFATADSRFEKSGVKSWDFGDLPETLSIVRNGQRLTGYPALLDDGMEVSVALLDTHQAADTATRQGVLRLLRLALKSATAPFDRGGAGFAQAALQLKTTIPTDQLLADVLAAVIDRAFLGDDPLPRSEQAFAEQVRRARARLPAVAPSAFTLLQAIASGHFALSQQLATTVTKHPRFAADVRAQRDQLVYPGFFAATPWAKLQHLPRYLKALDRRVVRYAERPERDAHHADHVAALWQRYRDRVERDRQAGQRDAAVDDFRWLLEELKVSLFAQELKTPFPVSFKRLEKAWSELAR